MLDGTIRILEKEQKDEEDRSVYCRKELKNRRGEKRGVKREIESLDAWRKDAKEDVAGVKEEIQGLKEEVAATDEAAEEATAERKAENALFETSRAENLVVVELLRKAQMRLAEFYGGGVLVEMRPGRSSVVADSSSPKPVLVDEDHGESTGADEDDGDIREGEAESPTAGKASLNEDPEELVPLSFLQSSSQGEEEEALSTATTRNKGAGASIERLLARLRHDLELEIQEAEQAERLEQEDFEKALNSAKTAREAKVQAMEKAETVLAERSAEIQRNRDRAAGEERGLAALLDATGDIHQECDPLLQNLEVRRQARAKEMEGLRRAKQVLGSAGG